MIIISKISIDYFRSLKKVTIKNVNHLNIFSGKNDIGKSNVLKALDTFFNKDRISFLDDFNKERLEEVRKESIKGKQYIKITLDLINPGTYSTLPNIFSVSKSWDRDGNQIEGNKDNIDSLVRQGLWDADKVKTARTSIRKFLNKIRFTYVPAIRDEQFFAFLLNKLQATIFEVEDRKKSQSFQTNILHFNKTIKDLTAALNNEFEAISGISSSLSFPNNVTDIFQRLIIDTKSGEHDIPLRLRGDGIRLRYIPTILNYISHNSKYYEIWGFDEPENSCEYSLSEKIAHQFASEYTNKTQIFVATHSFHFISLDTPTASKFRVFRKEDSENTEVASVNELNKNLLSDELGILDINKELANLYNHLVVERSKIKEIKSALAETKKPYLIFEGKTDNDLFEIAYSSLKGKELATKYTLCEHLVNETGSSIGSGANFINQFLYNHISKIPTSNKVIAVFDFDKQGVDELKAIKKVFAQLDSPTDNFLLFQHKLKQNVFAITLAAPSHRVNFVKKTHSQYCYLSTELLFFDDQIHSSNRDYPTLFDQTVFSFSGNKVGFTDRIRNSPDTINFSGFQPTFDLIDSIIRNY